MVRPSDFKNMRDKAVDSAFSGRDERKAAREGARTQPKQEQIVIEGKSLADAPATSAERSVGEEAHFTSALREAAPVDTAPETKDFEGAGGWRYRKNADGTIEITGAPEGHKAGAILSGGRAYDAILAEMEGREMPKPSQPTVPMTAEAMRQRAVDKAMPNLGESAVEDGRLGESEQDMGQPMTAAEMRRRAESAARERAGLYGTSDRE